MIDPVPTLGLDQIPPSFVSLVAGHNNMPDVHARVLDGQLFLHLSNTSGDDRNGGETLFKGDAVAPVTEITMPHMDGDVLLASIRNTSTKGNFDLLEGSADRD